MACLGQLDRQECLVIQAAPFLTPEHCKSTTALNSLDMSSDFVSSLLEEVSLVHHALPEVALQNVVLDTALMGVNLRAPLIVSAMPGDSPEITAMNRDLGRAAERAGVALNWPIPGVVSQGMDNSSVFQLRQSAPDLVLIVALDIVQIYKMKSNQLREWIRRTEANMLAVGIGPADELAQESGLRDVRGTLDKLAELIDVLPVPILVKERGCGLSAEAAASIAQVGIQAVDVDDKDENSWPATSFGDSGEVGSRQLLDELTEWGIPTAVSVVACARQGLQVVASGGVDSPLDVARSIALGARCGSIRDPVIRAIRTGGIDDVYDLLDQFVETLRNLTLLCGCRHVKDLARAPKHLGAELRAWLGDLNLL